MTCSSILILLWSTILIPTWPVGSSIPFSFSVCLLPQCVCFLKCWMQAWVQEAGAQDGGHLQSDKCTAALETWGLVCRKMKIKWTRRTVEVENFKRCFCVDILIIAYLIDLWWMKSFARFQEDSYSCGMEMESTLLIQEEYILLCLAPMPLPFFCCLLPVLSGMKGRCRSKECGLASTQSHFQISTVQQTEQYGSIPWITEVLA